METTELRIGNYINIDNPTKTQVSIFKIEKGVQIDCLSDVLHSPIPLTKEWLLKFGFEKSKTFTGLDSMKKSDFHIVQSVNRSRYDFMIIGSSVVLVTIEYVHELQNIYFDLKKEELPITKQIK